LSTLGLDLWSLQSAFQGLVDGSRTCCYWDTIPVIVRHGVKVGVSPDAIPIEHVLAVQSILIKAKFDSGLLGGQVAMVGLPLDTTRLESVKGKVHQGIGGLEHDGGAMDSRVEPDASDFTSSMNEIDIQ